MARITKNHADQIIKSGAFKNIQSYDDLHTRIKNTIPLNGQTLKTTQGDIFEMFIEGLLNVSNKFAETSNVWRVGNVPKRVREKLSLPIQDRGYDGVYQTKSGQLVSYQVKWRDNQNRTLSLNEPDHIGGFMGISRKVPSLHLFASCLGVVKDYTNQEGNLCTMINDFKNLSADTFQMVEGSGIKKLVK